MANDSVTTTFFANERDAVAALVRLEKKFAELEGRMGQMGRASAGLGDMAGRQLGSWVRNLFAISTSYIGLQTAVAKVIDLNKELIAQADVAGLKYDKIFRRMQVQTGHGGRAALGDRRAVEAAAVRAGVGTEYAETLAEELTGEGFAPAEATGGALRTMLETIRATGMGEVDPRQLAKAAAMFLSAQNKPKTDANLRPVMIAIQRLFKETSLKLEDLVDLSGRTELAAGSLTTPETLAMFDIIRQKNPADVASTAFKIIIERLQTIASRPGDVRALARLGLKPKEVDLVGEDIATVLDRLGEGLDRVSPEVQNMVMGALFEERARSPATGLIRDRKKMPELLAKMRDIAGFQKDVAVATGGKAAGRERFEAMMEQRNAARDTGFVDLLNAAELLAQEKGRSPMFARFDRWIAEFWKSIPGVSDETALFEGFGGIGGLSREDIRAKRDELESGDVKAQTRILEQQAKYLEEIAENTRARTRREPAGGP